MRRIAAFALVAALTVVPSARAFNDKDANDLILKVVKTNNILTKAAIGQLLYEGLLAPRPGSLGEVIDKVGTLRAKAAFLYLHVAKIIPKDYGHETIPAPAGNATTVKTKVEVPEGVDATSVSAWVTGWGLQYGPPPATKLAADGSLAMPTGVKGPAFIVMRSPQCDIAYGGDENKIMPRQRGQPFSPLEKSRLVLAPGDATLGFLFPYTATTDWGFPNLIAPKAVKLLRKTPGKAKFVYFAENSRDLSTSNVDPDQPRGRVEMVGDFNNWSTDPKDGTQKELFDDGGMVEDGSTDAVVGDTAYTRTLDLPRGVHAYAFLINGSPNLQRDPYEEGTTTVQIKTQLGTFKIRVSTITVE